jgi:hypothetical protein
MTLPFISYGGSSLLAMALTMGLALGLTRRRPKTGRLPRSRTSQAGEAGVANDISEAGASAGTNASEQTA